MALGEAGGGKPDHGGFRSYRGRDGEQLKKGVG